DGAHGDDRMVMVRRRDGHRINTLLLVEHFPKILVPFGVRVLLERMGCVIPVDVTKGNNILAVEFAQIGRTLAANADPSAVEFVFRRGLAMPAKNVPGQNHKRGRAAGSCQKLPSRNPLRAIVGVVWSLHLVRYAQNLFCETLAAML